MKRKAFVVALFFMAFYFNTTGQNLVLNHSFEKRNLCVQHDDQFAGYIANWTGGGGGSPSYFTICSGDTTTNTPNSLYGYQYAHTGISYAGIYTFIIDFPENRGYIQDSLTASLISGIKYYVTFYISLADNFQIACNNIGIYFSDSSLNYLGQTVKSYLIPQVTNNITNNSTDTMNWTKITGSYTAQGGEKYIVIGNFKDDAHSDTIHVKSTRGNPKMDWQAAYYYIDDVIVSPDSNYADSIESVQNISAKKTIIKTYPNPANSLLNVEVNLPPGQVAEICIYNSLGEKVACEELTEAVTTLPINNLVAGIYYYRIIDESGKLIKADKVMIIY